VPVDATELPKLIPDAPPPAVVLSPLMVFEVTVAVLVLPEVVGVTTIIPEALPFVVLNVLIVFAVTVDVTFVPSTWMPVRPPADEKFVIVLD
jgi:hypothetical protein